MSSILHVPITKYKIIPNPIPNPKSTVYTIAIVACIALHEVYTGTVEAPDLLSRDAHREVFDSA